MTFQREKAIQSTKWSAIERLTVQAVELIISIIIARLLMPEDYGIIGMIAIFIGVSQTFVDSGFSQALIYKTNRSQSDSSTVFFFNIVVGLVCYLIIYVAAPYVAEFYDMPILTPVTRVISLKIPINSLCVVQRALLTANSDFKSQSYASVPASLLSGVFGILLAYYGWGVWALVWQQLSSLFINTLLIWIVAKWRPSLIFSWTSFKMFFAYGSKLLASGLIDTLYTNSYLLVIGKFFKATELGLYSKAKTFPYFATVQPAGILQRAIFPILCEIKEERLRMANVYEEYLKLSISFTMPLVLGLAALSKPFVLLLLTEKWIAAVPIMQLLCLVYMMSPILMLNNNIYQVTGETGKFLKLEVIKKIVGITMLFLSIPLGIYGVIIGNIIALSISLLINMRFVSQIVPLTIRMQMGDILPIFLIAAVMAAMVWSVTLLPIPNIIQILLGILMGVLVYVFLLRTFQNNIYKNLKNILFRLLKK